jgi:hypothetical protein
LRTEKEDFEALGKQVLKKFNGIKRLLVPAFLVQARHFKVVLFGRGQSHDATFPFAHTKWYIKTSTQNNNFCVLFSGNVAYATLTLDTDTNSFYTIPR